MIREIITILLMFTIVIISILSIIFENSISNTFGYYDGCSIVNRFTYVFVHKNPLHLLLNYIMLFQINSFLDRVFVNEISKEKRVICITSYVICVTASFFSSSHIPTIGMSGYTSAKYGISLSIVDKKDIAIAVFVFVLYNSIMFIFGNFNCALHLICFFTGIAFGLIREYKYR